MSKENHKHDWCSPKALAKNDLFLTSLVLLPHVQHGFVIRREVQNANTSFDLVSNVMAIIQLGIDRVTEWISEGDLLSTYNLFPSPAYDYDYELLLHRQDLFKTELPKIKQCV